MEFDLEKVVSALIILLFLSGIVFFRSPRTARQGNWLNMAAFAGAVAMVVILYPLLNPVIAIVGVLAGGTVGLILANRVNMLGVPQMIAFQHSCGGIAAFLIGFAELMSEGDNLELLARAAAVLGIIVGAATFAGSLVAAGKLARKIRQTPIVMRGHTAVLSGTAIIMLVFAVVTVMQGGGTGTIGPGLGTILTAVLMGTLFTIRVGGADMPVIISFFNATAGLAAAFCGIAIGNYLLIGCGACVAASGSLLTLTMCRAMNRSFFSLLSISGTSAGHEPGGTEAFTPNTGRNTVAGPRTVSLDSAVSILREARYVIIVPGYGMALSQAQEQVRQLEDWLEKQGATVRYAIHPVAGRMPGHMNVLLAEAGVSYEKLVEMQEINNDFRKADLAIVIGAVMWSTRQLKKKKNTDLRMPVLSIQDARNVVPLTSMINPAFQE